VADDDGVIRREKKPKKEPEAKTAPAPAPSPAAVPAAAPAAPAKHDESTCPGCTRLRSALRETRKRLRRLITENRTLKEELLSASEMIEDLATDIEKPI
jgi:hypothetical protein